MTYHPVGSSQARAPTLWTEDTLPVCDCGPTGEVFPSASTFRSFLHSFVFVATSLGGSQSLIPESRDGLLRREWPVLETRATLTECAAFVPVKAHP